MSAGAKIVLNASQNDTKVNFQENISGKVQLQKKGEEHGPLAPPSLGGACNRASLSQIIVFFMSNSIKQVTSF